VTPTDLTLADYFALKILVGLYERCIKALDKVRHFFINETVLLGQDVYKNDALALELLGTFLTKLQLHSIEAEKGREFLGRARYLKTKAFFHYDLNQGLDSFRESFETEKGEIKKVITEASAKTENLKKEVEMATVIYDQLEGQTKRAEIRSVQVVAVFAAIIAFIVATIPFAVRVNEMGLLMAIAGLAIVIGGFLLLVAVLFGGKGRPNGWFLAIPIGLLALWFSFVLIFKPIIKTVSEPELKGVNTQVGKSNDTLPAKGLIEDKDSIN